MGAGGEGIRRPDGTLDPSTALTVGEAARLIGVAEATLRKRIQSGRLLHEIGRRAGREVQLVRLVDLADAYPELLEELLLPDGPAVEAERRPEAPSASPAAQGMEVAARGREHAFEVRLAALQTRGDALSVQVDDLHAQRTDLKEQCTDLRGRLTRVEQERQASTAGLLMAQRRLFELEAARPAEVGREWWQRRTTWGLASLLLISGWLLQHEWRNSRAASGTASVLAEELERAVVESREDRARFARELETWSDTFSGERSASERERQEFARRLEEVSGRATALATTVAEERERARLDRETSLADVASAREQARQAAGALQTERDTQAAARERLAQLLERREREASAARQETARALGTLNESVASSRQAAEDLSTRLEQRALLDEERAQQVTAELARLETLRDSTAAPTPWGWIWARWLARGPRPPAVPVEADSPNGGGREP